MRLKFVSRKAQLDMRWKAVFCLFSALSLQACAAVPCVVLDLRNGLDEASSMYPTGNFVEGMPTARRFAIAQVAEIGDTEPPTRIYPDAFETLWCKLLPEVARVQYSFRQLGGTWATVPLKAKIPADFYQSEVRGLRIVIDSREQPYVEYFMKLSPITSKWMTHGETTAEKQQRQLDEALWLALDADMTSLANREYVSVLLKKGARTIQPWMDANWNSPMPESVMLKALRGDHAEVIDLVMQHGGATVWLFEDIGASQLNQLIYAKRYDLLDVLLRNGVNPNFQDYVSNDWRYGEMPYRFDSGAKYERHYDERPLVIALMVKDTHAIKQLMAYGADTDFKLDKRGPYGAISFDEFFKQHVSPELQALVKTHQTTPNLAGVKKPDGYAHPNPNLRSRNELMLQSYDLPKPFIPYRWPK